MVCLLFATILFGIGCETFSSAEADYFHKASHEIDSDEDGEKFIKNLVNGKKPVVRPDFLLFTAPFQICKGGCNNTNISNFNMLFPIHIGNKKGQNIYKKLYSRDYHYIHSERDHAPFRESTTNVPYTQCPTCPNDSEEECTDYKFNEDMLHFLHLKGLIKNNEVKTLNEEFLKANGCVNIDDALVRRKRNGRIVGDSKEFTKDCCCPPRSIQIPAFITDSRFDEVIERINGMKKGAL